MPHKAFDAGSIHLRASEASNVCHRRFTGKINPEMCWRNEPAVFHAIAMGVHRLAGSFTLHWLSAP